MSGGLYGQLAVYPRSIQFYSLVYHIFVAPFKSQVSKPETLLEILCQLIAGDAVGDYGGSRVLLRNQSGRHSYYGISVYLSSRSVYCRRSVHIGVKDYAKICTVFSYRAADGGHSFLIFRIGLMVRKISVRLKELTAAYIRSEGV